MIAISRDDAIGRQIAAARMMAGLDQGQLAALAGVSGSTVSNIERGRNTTPASLKAIRRALRDKDVALTFTHDQAIVGICFVDRNAGDED